MADDALTRGERVAENEEQTFEDWAILELMGHRRLAGFVRTVALAGHPMIRLDVPNADGDDIEATQFYNASALYCLTPTSEETARRVAAASRPAPVQRWELPAAPESVVVDDDEVYDSWDHSGA